MGLQPALVIAAALIGVGVYGALSQQTFVMIMMGFELAINGIMLAGAAFWAYSAGGNPQGQLLVIVGMLVMAVEAAIGFALVIAVYRVRQADMAEGIDTLRG